MCTMRLTGFFVISFLVLASSCCNKGVEGYKPNYITRVSNTSSLQPALQSRSAYYHRVWPVKFNNHWPLIIYFHFLMSRLSFVLFCFWFSGYIHFTRMNRNIEQLRTLVKTYWLYLWVRAYFWLYWNEVKQEMKLDWKICGGWNDWILGVSIWECRRSWWGSYFCANAHSRCWVWSEVSNGHVKV